MPTLEKTEPRAPVVAVTYKATPRARTAPGEDRRITRSRAALRQALVELMEECGLENITVNDLCARAGLTRGTFYNHYADKDSLLEEFEQEILDDLAEFERRLGDLGMGRHIYDRFCHLHVVSGNESV